MMNNKEFAKLATNGDQVKFIHMNPNTKLIHTSVITYRPDKSKKTILDALSDFAKNGVTSLMDNVSSKQAIDGVPAISYLKNLQEETNKLPKDLLSRRQNALTVLVNKQTGKPIAYMFNICVAPDEAEQVNDLALDIFSKFTKAVHALDILPGNPAFNVSSTMNWLHILYHGQALTFVWLYKDYLKRC